MVLICKWTYSTIPISGGYRTIMSAPELSRTLNILLRFETTLAAGERAHYVQTTCMFISLQGAVPNYTQDLCVSSVSTRVDLRSAARGDLVVPRTRLHLFILGNRAFSVAGPVVWNSLPTDIRSAPTLCTFRNRLRLICFYSRILYFDFHQLNSSSVCCTAPL